MTMISHIDHKQIGRVELYVAKRRSLGINARHERPVVGIAGDLLRVVLHSSPASEFNCLICFIARVKIKHLKTIKRIYAQHTPYNTYKSARLGYVVSGKADHSSRAGARAK